MAHHTKDKGDLAVARTIAHLLEHDIRVCTPLSEHLPFDFVAVMPDMRTLRRVQVKYRTMKYGGVEVSFRSNYYDSKKIYSVRVNLEHLDCYALFCPDNEAVYYLRIDEIPAHATTLQLRIRPAQNGQVHGISFARDYVDPCRIAPLAEAPHTEWTPHVPSPAHERVVAKVTNDLMDKGMYVCTPNSVYIPFDLIAIAPDMMTLQRVQVCDDPIERSHFADLVAVYDSTAKCIRYESCTSEQVTG